MKTKQLSSKQLIALVLILIGAVSSIFGITGLTKSSSEDPYESRNGIVMVYATVYDNEGNSEAGMAILQLPSPTDKRTALTLRDSGDIKIGDTAYALGYPGNSSQRQDFATYDIDDITITRGIISKRTTTSFSTYEAFQMDVSIAPGNSGGPLVDEKGNVIGINVAGAIDPNTGLSLGMNYAIIINELTKILDVERIPYTFSSSGFSLFHGPGSAVLLLLGILLIAAGTFFFWKERKAAASVTNNRSGLADRNSGLANGSASGLNGNPVHSGAAGSSGAHAILRGMTGSYAGQSFDLLKGKVTIGRDPTFCNIVYEKSTPGISSRHCQLSYNPGESCFVLTDLGSSYGTFLGNGKKLAPNVPEKLYAGDTFFLCDPSNRFLVAKE